MLLSLDKPEDYLAIQKYGKAYGTVLLQKYLPELSSLKNIFILDSSEELEKIMEILPEEVICRADAKTGERPVYKVRGKPIKKEGIEEYIKIVKNQNSEGVVICIVNENGTKERVNTQGAFNVYFEMRDRVLIDYVGRGFDNGEITKGIATHECWSIPWEEVLFTRGQDLNKYRNYIISDEAYLETARERIKHLIRDGISEEEIRGKIPKKYIPMSIGLKDMILDQIMLPLYLRKEELSRDGLTSFGVQGLIVGNRLFPVEVNRRARFAEKKFLDDGR